MTMRRTARIASLLAAAAGLLQPACQAATAEELARVQLALQQAAAPWCERLSERDAQGRKRCTIKLTALVADKTRAFSFPGEVAITQPLLSELTEAELALVGGHEFAHLVLGHALIGARLAGLPGKTLAWLERSTVPPHAATPEDRHQLELDADRLGLFFAGLAGYPVQDLAAGWRRMLARLPVRAQTGEGSHPSAELRATRLQQAAQEFCALGQRGAALMPELERLQPHYEADIDALREQQAQLPVQSLCRPPASS